MSSSENGDATPKLPQRSEEETTKGSSNDEKSAEEEKSSPPITGNDAEQVSCSTVGTANKTQHHSWADAEDEDEAHPKELATVQKKEESDHLTKQLQKLALERQKDNKHDRLRVVQADSSSHLSFGQNIPGVKSSFLLVGMYGRRR